MDKPFPMLEYKGHVCARDAARHLDRDYSRVLRACRELGSVETKVVT